MRHLEREISRLKRRVLGLSAIVEESVYKAVKAVTERDVALAEEVIQNDEIVDRTEVEVEEDCLKILALYQPVATDLRYIISVLKMDNDLERIGDLAVNIAHRAAALTKHPSPGIEIDFGPMAKKVQAMLRDSLVALVNLDVPLAMAVCKADDEVDEMNREMHDVIRQGIRTHIEDLEALTYYMSVSRNLERIADHATNIAEDVFYMVEGTIIRHGHQVTPLAGDRD